MSIKQVPSTYRSQRALRKQVWAECFGMLIARARERSGRSVEDASQRAGLDPAYWQQIEAGSVPDWAELQRVADGIGVPVARIVSLVYLCSEAWD